MTIKRLFDLLPEGEVLLIVPPGAPLLPSLGPHSLQSAMLEENIKANVFYANFDFANVIGIETYNYFTHTLAGVDPINSIFERLFVSSAYGIPDLGFNSNKIFEPEGFPLFSSGYNWIPKEKKLRNSYFDLIFKGDKKLNLDELKRLGDVSINWLEEIVNAISKKKFRVVGCSITFGVISASIGILKGLKEKNRNTITIIGGAKCAGDLSSGIVKLSESLDYVFNGEGEYEIIKFIKQIRNEALWSAGAKLESKSTRI